MALAALLFIQPSKGAIRGLRRKPEPAKKHFFGRRSIGI
jgi:hypothetical protein